MFRHFGSVRDIARLYAIVFALVTAGFGLAVYFATDQALAYQVDARLADEASAIVGTVRPVSIPAMAARIADRERRRSTSDLGYLLINATGRRIAGKLDMKIPALGYSDVTFGDGLEGGDRGRALATSFGKSGTLVIVADSEPVEAFDSLLIKIFAAAFGAAIVVGVVGGAALSRAIGLRIAGMNRTAQAIIDGDMTRRMPIEGSGGEFDSQSALLNTMLDKIGELLANLRQVSSDVAHDLRTPLVRLRNRLEDAGREHRSLAEMRVGIQAAVRESDALLDLFAALLRISEIEAGARRAAFTNVDLLTLVLDQAETFTLVCEDHGQHLAVASTNATTVWGDRELLAQMLINLLENAIRHTPTNTNIALALDQRGEKAILTITDDGLGIAGADTSELVRRFTRLDPSRTTAGYGLGLALVNAIVRLHDGSLSLADGNPGLRVEVVLPLAARTPSP